MYFHISDLAAKKLEWNSQTETYRQTSQVRDGLLKQVFHKYLEIIGEFCYEPMEQTVFIKSAFDSCQEDIICKALVVHMS